MRLHNILSNEAHGKLLEVLQHAKEPFSTRELISLSGTGTRSAMLALEDLLSKDILLKTHVGQEVRYELNRSCKYYVPLMESLKTFYRQFLKERVCLYEERTKKITQVIDELLVLSQAKKVK